MAGEVEPPIPPLGEQTEHVLHTQPPLTADDLVGLTRNQFLQSLQKSCSLTDREVTALETVSPATWCAFGLSVFGDNEVNSVGRYDPAAHERFDPSVRGLMGGPEPGTNRGLYNYALGGLTRYLDTLYSSRDPHKLEYFDDTTHLLGALVATSISSPRYGDECKLLLPAEPQTRIQFDGDGQAMAALVDSHNDPLPLDGPIDRVVNIGPGLTAATFVRDLRDKVSKVYLLSRSIGTTFQKSLCVVQLAMDGSRQDRQAAGVDTYVKYLTESINCNFADLQQREVQPDAVVMSAFHFAGRGASFASVHQAFAALRPGGAFVVKAPNKSLCEHEAGLDLVMPLAAKLFGPPVASGRCGRLSVHHGAGYRDASYQIYRKPEKHRSLRALATTAGVRMLNRRIATKDRGGVGASTTPQ